MAVEVNQQQNTISQNLEFVLFAKGKVFGQAFFKKLVEFEAKPQGLNSFVNKFLKGSKELLCKTNVLL